MALRQKLALPGFEWHLRDKLVQPKALRPPFPVEFRRGAIPGDVVADMMQHSSVQLCAAVGSGKSVKIPSALAAKTRAVVFHVVPGRQLAGHLFGYLVKVSQMEDSFVKVPVEHYSGDPDSIPRNGVFLISAVDMVDVIMRHGGLHKFKGCSVFLDEAHESDAYTHTVRSLALQLGAERLVQASATFTPEVRGTRNTPGSVAMKPVDLGPVDAWEVDRNGSPFQVATMRDGILVFVDSRSAATKLAIAYERAGLDVFRLTAHSSDAEVSAAMLAAGNKNGGLVAILADYSYRSGFTFPVSRVVDVGEVSYYDSEPGAFKRLTRRMFQFEREQAAGRVGRIYGDADYYYQKGECPAVMCDLEGVEREAAAYIYRCLGFNPDGVLRGAFMARADLPSSVSVRAALNGPYPLTYYVKHVDEARKVPKNEYVERAKSVEVDASPPSYDSVKSEGEKRDSGVDVKSDNFDWDSMVDDFASRDSSLELQDGIYYVSQVRDSQRRGVAATMTFPAGLSSVREFAGSRNFRFAVTSLSREDRMWAFSVLLDRYNTITAQVKGAKAAVQETCLKSKAQVFVDKVRDVMEELAADHADAVSCLKAAESFAMSPSWVVPYDGVLKAELAAKEGYFKQFADSGRSRSSDDLDDDIASGVGRRLERSVKRDRDKGRVFDDYSGRKHELLMPSWLGGKKIAYESVMSGDSHHGKDLKIMHREYGHDDKYDYRVTRRYTRITY